ncbi:MAG: acyl-CoA dehydrogenase family protein [Deltaproteobacteria bacterium]|nr:acyl-CoA dehydrogenase family protein [Deltaproteobacteria bacterium]MBW1818109.1 acyl-CoA dehydrogenase family protein [Deltaproteobacteria bacterium]
MTTKYGRSNSDGLYFNEEQQMLRRTVADFVDKEINPNMDKWEEEGQAPLHELFKKMGDLGLLGIRYDPRWGGQGLDHWFDLVFIEELGHIHGGGVGMAIGVQTHMATPAIAEFGSDYLKETYLKPAVMGDMVSCVGITEPGAGSDVAGLKTRAVKDGDEWLINGSKLFITNGVVADYCTLLCRTDDKPGYHTFSLIVVPTDTPGFSIGQKLDKLGMRCSDTALLYLDNVRVPLRNTIGEEGQGFIYQMKQFQHERFFPLPGVYVTGRDVIDMTVEYIRQREVFGEPLIAKQVLRHRLADWVTELELLKQMTYHIVRMKEADMDVTREVTMGKLYAGRLIRRVVDGCLQMFGGTGYINENIVTRHYRDTRLLSIGGGADEVMSDVLSKIEGF